MPAGRPIEYNYAKLKPLIDKYIEECNDTEEQQTIGRSAKGTELFKVKTRVHIPTIEGLSIRLGINKTTIYDWESKYEEFSHDIDKVRALQAERLLNKGLSGDYNPTIAKVLLTKHGYREGIDQTSNVKSILVMPTELIDKYNLNDTNTSTKSNSEV